jgi:hypothetical protein
MTVTISPNARTFRPFFFARARMFNHELEEKLIVDPSVSPELSNHFFGIQRDPISAFCRFCVVIIMTGVNSEAHAGGHRGRPTPAAKAQHEEHRNALDGNVLQKTPVLAMAQAQRATDPAKVQCDT